MAENDVNRLIDMLYERVEDAKSHALKPNLSMVDRDEVLDLLDELRNQLPVELKRAQELLAAREKFVDEAKRDVERMMRQADVEAKSKVSDSEVLYAAKEKEIGAPLMRELERIIMLRVVDEYWMDHIDAMQDLRQGIRLRAYAQTNPVDAYKKESLEMFEEMIDAMKEETVRRLYSVRLRQNEEVKRERVASGMTENVGGDGTVKKRPTKVVKVGRNDLCPCGSGLKWKKCTCKEYHS